MNLMSKNPMAAPKTFAGFQRAVEKTIAELERRGIPADLRVFAYHNKRVGDLLDDPEPNWTAEERRMAEELKNRLMQVWNAKIAER